MRTERGALSVAGALLTLAVTAYGAALVAPAAVEAQEVGPPNGSLVIVGGAMRSQEIANRFVQLAGGTDARIVVIPTAGGAESYGPSFGGVRPFQAAGVEHLTVRHTNDRDEANSDAFVAAIREATGVWFTGGRQWRLVDSYAGTRTEEELWALLERGGGDRRLVGRRDDPGVVPGARGHGDEHDHDGESRGGVRLRPKHGDRPAPPVPEPPVRHAGDHRGPTRTPRHRDR